MDIVFIFNSSGFVSFNGRLLYHPWVLQAGVMAPIFLEWAT